jgi:hypothetical protein
VVGNTLHSASDALFNIADEASRAIEDQAAKVRWCALGNPSVIVQLADLASGAVHKEAGCSRNTLSIVQLPVVLALIPTAAVGCCAWINSAVAFLGFGVDSAYLRLTTLDGGTGVLEDAHPTPPLVLPTNLARSTEYEGTRSDGWDARNISRYVINFTGGAWFTADGLTGMGDEASPIPHPVLSANLAHLTQDEGTRSD